MQPKPLHGVDPASSYRKRKHADQIATRITQLNGVPNFDPEGLGSRSRAEYIPGDDLVSMVREDLVAERIAIEIYTEIIHWLGNADPTTKLVIEGVLTREEEHAEDLATLLARLLGENLTKTIT